MQKTLIRVFVGFTGVYGVRTIQQFVDKLDTTSGRVIPAREQAESFIKQGWVRAGRILENARTFEEAQEMFDKKGA